MSGLNILDMEIDDPPIYEMASVGVDRDAPLKVRIDQEMKHPTIPYFKVFNDSKLKEHETEVTRLHFMDPGIEDHSDSDYLKWVLTNDGIKNIIKFLRKKHHREKDYTNWQMTKWLWNLTMMQGMIDDDNIDDYMRGDLDELMMSDRNPLHKIYVPSYQPIPETWDPNWKPEVNNK